MDTLTLNQEQDSTGKNEYRASLYTPASGSFQGVGATPEDAILDLAGKIRQAKNQKAVDRLGFNARKALIQPMPAVSGILGGSVDETLADIAKISNVGKIVHYTPGSDDVEQGGGILPAIITREWNGGRMDLQVFGNKVSGTSSRYSVEFSTSRTGGTWDWPKKA